MAAVDIDYAQLAGQIKTWGQELGFQQVGITGTELSADEARLIDWLNRERHGEMSYMARHGELRSRPSQLLPGTVRIISARMDYHPNPRVTLHEALGDSAAGFISSYALGRDYHKVMRKRLQRLAVLISSVVGDFGFRAFVDSAPILEKAVARNAGLGWIGKHTNLINKQAGSWFFLGELFSDLPLPVDDPATDHCGSCRACLDVCPTGAIVAPYELDARRCISYLTIELRDTIPVALRPLIGNRIYGCDDCQLVCPWNKFSQPTMETDFQPRRDLDATALIEFFSWDKDKFLSQTEGSAIRRIGYECWLRNVAVALGNAPTDDCVVDALHARRQDPSSLVREHVHWALAQHADWGDPHQLREASE